MTRSSAQLSPAHPDPAFPPLEGDVHVWLRTCPPRSRSEPALRELLGAYLQRPANEIALRRTTQGRIEFAPAAAAKVPAIGFGVSHSHELMALAFARDVHPGIDIERLQPRPRAIELAQRFFPADESRALEALPRTQALHAFYLLWTAREAIVKAMGRGIAFGLHRLHFDLADPAHPRLADIEGDDATKWQLHQRVLPPTSGTSDLFVFAVAWRGTPRPLRWMPPLMDLEAGLSNPLAG